MSYTSNSSIPSIESSSYVLLLLAIGVLKRSVPEMVVFNSLIPEQEKEMIKTGVGVIEGTIKPEAYIKKLETLVKKSVKNTISFDDDTVQQLLGRLNLSKSPNAINQKLDKETSKAVKHDGTLKPMKEAASAQERYQSVLNAVSANIDELRYQVTQFSKQQRKANGNWGFVGSLAEVNAKLVQALAYIGGKGALAEDASEGGQPISKNDPRFDKLPEDGKMLIYKALHSWGALKDFSDPVTSPKLDFALNRFKKNMTKFSPATALEVNKVLAAIDPANWKQYKPEPVVQDYQLNSVESDKEVLDEAIDREQIKNLIKQKGSATMLDLLTAIGGKPSQPPNNQQVSLFMAVKKMLAKGEVTRVKDGKHFKYSIGNGTPQVASTKSSKQIDTSKPGPIKGQIKSVESVLPIINSTWSYRPWESEGRDWLSSESGDRGPRTDHGGGEDGDGWMSNGQIQRVAEPYYKKWKPRLEQLKADLAKKGIDVEVYVDYGEKGHVGLQMKIKNLAEKGPDPQSQNASYRF